MVDREIEAQNEARMHFVGFTEAAGEERVLEGSAVAFELLDRCGGRRSS